MKSIFDKVFEKAMAMSDKEFLSAIAQHQDGEFAKLIQQGSEALAEAIDFHIDEDFQVHWTDDIPSPPDEDFEDYDLAYSANDERFALAA